MKTLWVDPSNGAAGDMLLAALVDAGANLDRINAALTRLAVEPIVIGRAEVRRHGFRATKASVSVVDSHTHRGLRECTEIVAAAQLPAAAHDFAVAVFQRLATAEARVHGTSIDEVHFHEVGALDAIADVVGCAVALADLDLLGSTIRIVGPVAVGSGTAMGAHGRLPIPAPAVLELLTAAGGPIVEHPARMELCTPTGAALLATLATQWGPPPSCTPRAVGVGAGTRDPAGHPNIVRVLIGDAVGKAADWNSTTLHRVDTTVDDLDPRVWPDLLERLREAGAADAWCSPALMRKGRPGQVLSVLVGPALLDLVCRIIFEQTTTLGVRVSDLERRSLDRDQITVRLGAGSVRVKRGFLGNQPVTVSPEYDDVLEVARLTGQPVARLLNDARQAALAPEGLR